METGSVYYIPRVTDTGEVRRGIVLEYSPEPADGPDGRIVGRVWLDMSRKAASRANFSNIGPIRGPLIRENEFVVDLSQPDKAYLNADLAVPLGKHRKNSDITRAIKPPRQIYPHIRRGLRGYDRVSGVPFRKIISVIKKMKKRVLKKKEERDTLRRLKQVRRQIYWIVLLERISNLIDDRLTKRIRTEMDKPVISEIEKYDDAIRRTLLTSSRLRRLMTRGDYDASTTQIREEPVSVEAEGPTPGRPPISFVGKEPVAMASMEPEGPASVRVSGPSEIPGCLG